VDDEEKMPTFCYRPFFCQLFNSTFESGPVPSSFKSGYVTPLMKKADLDDAADHVRSVWRLQSARTTRCVEQLVKYLTENARFTVGVTTNKITIRQRQPF